MAVESPSQGKGASVAQSPVVYWLAVVLVILGLLNVTPAIPGWDGLWKTITGYSDFKIRRFPTEWLYPIVFAWMMLIVALAHSIWQYFRGSSKVKRGFGLLLDLALVFAAILISLTYLIEIEAVCLIDVLTGDRVRLMAEALQSEIEYMEMMGLPIPDTADDPACLNTTHNLLPLILFGSVVIFLAYNIKVWGLPLVLVSIFIASYTFLTVMNWYFFGPDGQNKYLVTILSSEEVRSLTSGREFVRDALVNNGSGLLGRFINILMLLVFPYIILGALFGQCSGGKALIKLAFSLTRNLRGGPAHAAVVSSAMFGTITGGPVVNVLSTGVLTIPMMLKRGFSRVFAGGVRQQPSGLYNATNHGRCRIYHGGANRRSLPRYYRCGRYSSVVLLLCLFLSVAFQARKQKIEAVGELTEDMLLTKHDKLQLLQIFGPVLLVLALLLTPKDAIGCSWFSILLGGVVEVSGETCKIISLPWLIQLLQNSAGDASAAGWWAVMLLIGLMFLDPEFRARPRKYLMVFQKLGS